MNSEKPFNYIEHKIKEAAENQLIVFEESSWKKMEALLDNEPRHKPFVWWWFLLPLVIAGGVGFWLVANKKNTQEKNNAALAEKIQVVKKTNTIAVTIKANTPLNIDKQKRVSPKLPASNFNNISANDFKISKKTNSSVTSKTATLIHVKTAVADEENILPDKNIFTEKSKANFLIHNGNATENDIVLNNTTNAKTDSATKIIKEIITAKTKTDSSNAVVKKEKITVKNKAVSTKFYVIGSMGADVSGTKLFSFKNSPASLKYGLAVGFNINKKLSVQTGFYAGKKKYIAGEGEYNFKSGSYYTMVKIIKVDADCIVYEIPVSVRYNIVQKKSMNIYTGVGLSSYIMKKEDYNVFFVRNYMEVSRPWNYSGNKHFLSALVLSAGAEKKLSNKLALQIEPAITVPLKGVGEGTVKLFSTSLLLGLKYFPFK